MQFRITERAYEVTVALGTAVVVNILVNLLTLSRASEDVIRQAFFVQFLVIILANIRIPESALVVPFAWFHLFHLIVWMYVLMGTSGLSGPCVLSLPKNSPV